MTHPSRKLVAIAALVGASPAAASDAACRKTVNAIGASMSREAAKDADDSIVKTLTYLYAFTFYSSFAIAEGAGIVILESEERAKKRDVPVYGYIIGYGTTTDGVDRIQPSDDGVELANAIRMALDDAGREPAEIDYICADGAATPIGDATETLAIKKVFNASAKKIPVTAPKAVFGNMLGASGAVDVISTVLAMEHKTIPPTINYSQPDPDCDLDYCPNKSQAKEIRNALIINRGRGGINCALVLSKN